MQEFQLNRAKRKLSIRVDESDALWQLLRRTSRAIAKTRERELGKYGFTPDEAVVIFTVLRQGPSATAASIARELLLEPNSVSEQLKRMEKDGFIERVREADTRGRTRIDITEKGFEIFRKSQHRKSTRDVMSALSPSEVKTVWVLLARIRDRALSQLGMHSQDAYPPASPELLRSASRIRRLD